LRRQQTLAAAVTWSYDLLTSQERQLFDRLSVFSGGCSLEAVEHVCGGDGIDESDVVDLVLHLVDKSLVLADEDRGETTRYRLLETLRQSVASGSLRRSRPRPSASGTQLTT
jgi:predicted ATPase